MNNALKMIMALSILSTPLMVRAQDTSAAPSNPTTVQEAKQEVKQDKKQLRKDRAKLKADKKAKRALKHKTAPTTPAATN